MPKKAATSQGFTLIELLIVVSLSVLLMLAASSLFMTLLIGSTKTTSTTLVKQEGNAALQQLDFLFRNAINVLPNSSGQTCAPAMTEIYLESIDGGQTRLQALQDALDSRYKIASTSAATPTSPRFLTSGAVELVGNSISVSCVQSTDLLTKYVTISFTLRKGVPAVDQPRDIVEQTFSLSTNIRSF